MAISPPLNEPPSPEVFDSPPSPSPESTVNPLFDSPEIRAFLFDTSDNLLSDLANGRSLETSFEADDERFRVSYSMREQHGVTSPLSLSLSLLHCMANNRALHHPDIASPYSHS